MCTIKYKITDTITMMINGFICILGVFFFCKIQRAIIKNIWQKLPIASTMDVTESVRRISFGAGSANHMKLGSIIIRKSKSLHISKQNL